MIEENMAVYETLRDSIIHLEDGIQTAYVYMFTVYFALLALGYLYNEYIFLGSFFVLIVFQNIINTNRFSIERISSYIRVFLEERRNDIHWELLNKDAEHERIYHEHYRNIGWRIKTWGASILAVFSLFSMASAIFQVYGMESLPVKAWLELLAALFLCAMTIYINSEYLSKAESRKGINDLDESIIKFYNKFCNNAENG